MTEKTISLLIKRFGRALRQRGREILILLLIIYALNYTREHFFVLENNSEAELKRAFIVKSIQLQGISTDTYICNENIQGCNITGYQFMSLNEIQDRADSVGNLNYCCISEITFNGIDARVTVMNICRRTGFTSELSGATYRFHRYFLNLWEWNKNIFFLF